MKRLLFVVMMAFASLAQGAAYSLPWGPKPQWVDANGAPMSSGTLTFYAAGTTTLQNTYTTQAGSVANTNPVTLNSRGESPNEVWLGAGQTYKLVLKDSSGSTVWTVDNITGVNDPAATITEWVGGATPTYVSANSFTALGDYTTLLTPGRRLKLTVTSGTVYGTIYTSVFTTPITTVTMVMDSTGNLDSGLSALSYGFLHSTNPSIPSIAQVTLASAATVNLASANGDSLHVSGVTGITSFGNAPSGLRRTVVFDGALTLTHNGTSLILPNAANITTAAGDVAIFVSEGSGNWRCISYAAKNAYFSGINVSGSAILSDGAVGAATGAAYFASDTDTGMYRPAANAIGFFGAGAEQARITGTASATRYITLTGSNGGNPTIDVSAGSLAITPSTTMAANLTLSSPSAVFTMGNQTSNIGGQVKFLGSSSQINWEIAQQTHTFVGGLEITPSTATGGATFSAPVVGITSAGYFKASNSGSYSSASGLYHELAQSSDTGVNIAVFRHNGATATNQYGVEIDLIGDPNDATRYFLKGLGGAGVTERFTARSNGGLANFSANNVNLSDATVKTGLRPAGSYWNFIKDLAVVDGWYTDDLEQRGAAARRHTMLTAQQVQAVEQKYDLTGPRSVVTQFDQAGHLGVQEHSIEMRHLTVTQELQARVEQLEKRLAELEERVAQGEGMQYTKKAKRRVAANDSTHRQTVNQ